MKRIICYLVLLGSLINTAKAQGYISITNTSNEKRLEVIAISYPQFSKHFEVDSIFTIKEKSSGRVCIHQLEKLGLDKPVNVLIQVSVPARGKIELEVIKKKAPNFSHQTYARYVPERYDDFAWENDIVAFRMYGKSLEGKKDDAQGMDFWAKRTTNLIIDKWYKSEDYHQDHGEGLDYYSVGQTLGAGDIALFLNNTIIYTKHYRKYQILDNGPIRSTFRLIFEPEIVNGQEIAISKIITLDAGQNFNKIVVDLQNKHLNRTPIVIGIARRGESQPQVQYNSKEKTLVYWEPNIKDFGQTGTAIILTTKNTAFHDSDNKQFMLSSELVNHKSMVYYAGAAWNKAGKITSYSKWKKAVKSYAAQITHPLIVKLK